MNLERLRRSLESATHERFIAVPPTVLCLELFLGIGWLRAAAEKSMSRSWWDGEELREFASQREAIGWFEPVVATATSLAPIVSAAVLVAELAIGLALLVGRARSITLPVGLVLASAFVLAGQPNPGAFYIVMHIGLLVWWLEHLGASNTSIDTLRVICVASTALSIAVIPWISTMHPAEVIEDPALVILAAFTVFAISAFSSMLRHSRTIARHHSETGRSTENANRPASRQQRRTAIRHPR